MNFNKSIIYKLHEIVYTSDILAEMLLQKELQVSYNDFLTLMYISEFRDFTQNDLAQSLRIGKSALSIKLSKLEKSGFLKRSAKASSKRENDLNLTAKGAEIVQKAGKLLENSSQVFLKGVSKDLENLDSLLEKVLLEVRNNASKFSK